MAKISITLDIKLSWWVIPYINAVEAFGSLTGLSPDYDKVVATAMRGVRIKMVDSQ